jgi:hypothetical protein
MYRSLSQLLFISLYYTIFFSLIFSSIFWRPVSRYQFLTSIKNALHYSFVLITLTPFTYPYPPMYMHFYTKQQNRCSHVRFQVLTAASMKFRIVFWDVLPCKISLMMEAARTSETSVDNYFTQQYIPEDTLRNLYNSTKKYNDLQFYQPPFCTFKSICFKNYFRFPRHS